MTVEEYLRAKLGGFPVDINVLSLAVLSPTEVGLTPLSLTDDVAEILADEDLSKSLKYALSTLYYSASGYFTGMKQSEQVGDVRASISSFTIDWGNRYLWHRLANKLREELGFEPEEDLMEANGTMFDATSLARRPKYGDNAVNIIFGRHQGRKSHRRKRRLGQEDD